MKWILLILVFLSQIIFADPAPIELENVHLDVVDHAAVLRGAKFFASTCMVCHTMKYLEHDPLAEQAGITLDKMPLNIKQWSFGVTPPDLTLEARRRSPEWIYTYLHSFYKDPSRPTGYNNLLLPDVNMMDVLAPLQGVQDFTKAGHERLEHAGVMEPPYYAVLKLVKSGSMTPEEFDDTITDLVDFLVYAGEPHMVERKRLGVWVLLFLVVFLILAYLLKKEIWKDVK